MYKHSRIENLNEHEQNVVIDVETDDENDNDDDNTVDEMKDVKDSDSKVDAIKLKKM